MSVPYPLNKTAAAVAAVLLPYQQAWAADKSQVKVVEKSRRIGLSWGGHPRRSAVASLKRRGLEHDLHRGAVIHGDQPWPH